MARSKSRTPNELVYSLFALLIAVIVVHAIYVTLIRPKAAEILEEQRIAMQSDENYVTERSIYVVLKDWEQEACVILALWALSMIVYKGYVAHQERKLLSRDLVHVPEGMRILPEDAREYARAIEALPASDANGLVPRALLVSLYRFSATRNVQDVSDAARGVCEAEAGRLDSELSMLRYIAWAIPAIGFIGTVRGIGDALGEAHKAVTGDVSGVTAGLGTAFNSTLIALLISIGIMFLLHRLQLEQERLVLDSETYLDQHLIRHMQPR
jgi:biopolymer transport protein ExbB/TolQ